MKKQNFKNTRRNEEVKKELTSIISQEMKDPRISTMTSVVDVDLTTDLQQCKVYISVMGDETAQADTIAGLKSASGFARKELARRLNLRNTPTLEFVLDNSIEYGVNMSKKIREVMDGSSMGEGVDE